MRLTFDQAAELLDEIAESFPPALFDGLNGGVNLLEEAKPDPPRSGRPGRRRDGGLAGTVQRRKPIGKKT